MHVYQRSLMAFVLVIVLNGATAFCLDATEKKTAPLQPIPSAVAIEKADHVIAEVYGAELSDPLPSSRLRLALKMLNDASHTRDDPTGKYALLLKARDLAVEAGDLQTAFDCIQALAAEYTIDGPAMGRDTLGKIAPKLDTIDERALLASYGLFVLQQFANTGRYGELPSLYPLIQNAAKLSASGEVRARVKEAFDRLELAAAEYRKLKPAFDALAANPNDPQANDAVGKFYLLFASDPAKGLSLVAKGPGPDSANPWRVLALRDLANPDAPEEQASLADDWWMLAEQQTVQAKDRLEARSLFWYRRALPGLTGLAKTVAEKRLAAGPSQDSLARDDLTPPRHEVVIDPPGRAPPANPRTPRIVIISARWGGGRRWADVTDKVRQLFADDMLFYANPPTLGVDPTPGWRKRLEITYIRDGERKKLILDEDKRLDPLQLAD